MRYAVIQSGLVANIVEAEPEFASEQGWIEAPAGVDIGWSYDGATFASPIPPLDQRKLGLWERVKRIRDQRIDGGVAVPGIGRFDTDPISRSNINGAVTGALIAQTSGQPFSVSWKLADNSIRTLNAVEMIGAGTTALAHVAACHANSQLLGVAILGAADHTALDAIDIGAGWP